MSPINANAPATSLTRIYTAPVIIVCLAIAWIFWIVTQEHYTTRSESLIAPMAALFALTALVWFVMVTVRNVAVIRGYASVSYYADFKSNIPTDDRLERPARTFNNLMQVPSLLYVICILMLIAKETDNAQIILAWTFVILRCLHAIIYMAVNWVPYRFATWAASCIALGVIWFRYVVQVSFG